MLFVTYQVDNERAMLKIKGHAHDYSEAFDSVCGMVSVLAESCLWGCLQYSDDVEIIHRKSGHLEFKCTPNDKVKAVMNTCLEGIKQVRMQFPECFGGD